jgi:hypothetical protein
VQGYLADAQARGASVQTAGGADAGDSANRRLPLSIVIDPAADSEIARHEIFGPALVVRPYDDVGQAIDAINADGRPLALYYFGQDAAEQQAALTLKSKADTTPEAMAKMLEAFAPFGVTKEHIEKRIQRRLDAIAPAQVVQLKRIYASLRDEMSTAAEWFEIGEASPPAGATASLDAVRQAFPHLKILVRAHDRMHYMRLVSADIDLVVRELFHSALEVGRIALRELGATEKTIDAITEEYVRRDNERLALQVASGDIMAGRDTIFRPGHGWKPENPETSLGEVPAKMLWLAVRTAGFSNMAWAA